MKNTLKIIVINLLVVCALLAGIEILGQLVYVTRKGNFLFLEDAKKRRSVSRKIFELHPYLVVRPKASVKVQNGKKVITTTDDHTRWTGANQEDHDLIRIAVLGGSTSFGTGVTDKDSWPALLQEKLGKRFAVINYGVPGYSTAEAIIQMALIIPEKRPHIVLFYEGWNDIRNYHEIELGADYYGHGIRQFGNFEIPNPEIKKSVFATVWLISRIKSKIVKTKDKNMDLSEEPDPFVDRLYIRNMKTLKLLTENLDAYAVFIPQVLNYSNFQGGLSSKEWTRRIKNDAVPTLMDRFNSLMKGICAQEIENCMVLSEVTKEKWSKDDFVDDGHFSRSGGLKFAEIITQLVRSKYE